MNLAHEVTRSTAATAFDHVAASYDELFTHTAIGRAQRNQVWRQLLAAFVPGSRILELNCGTGEDARFLANRGRSVLACDASNAMIEMAKRRGQEETPLANIEHLHLATEDLARLFDRGPYDGAFSNFSGLNCLADLKPVARNLAVLLKPGGRVLLCLWSRLCWIEIFWCLFHGQLKKAARRLSKSATARLGDMTIPVFYPSVRSVRRSFSPWFELRSRCAVGLFVPPSYVEQSIRKHEWLLELMKRLDRECAAWPILRDAGDHVLLEFVRCNS
jgi:ubiquinone/menaquinone biosynthesis C-methylase UbiE